MSHKQPEPMVILSTQSDSPRVQRAKQALLDAVTIRSDGKPNTPDGLTRELILALLEQAGAKGMTAKEIAKHYPHRKSPSNKMLRSMESEQLIVKLLGGRFVLREFADSSNAKVVVLDQESIESHDEMIFVQEDEIEQEVRQAKDISETEKQQIILARRGQGKFRRNVSGIEKCCRVTKIDARQFLIASHIKPWRSSTNEERLDGENGLMLSPAIDFLFDHGLISFEDDGRLLISKGADLECLQLMGVDGRLECHCGSFSTGQKNYLAFHRTHIFGTSDDKK